MNQLSEIIEDSILSNVLTEDEIAEYLKETINEMNSLYEETLNCILNNAERKIAQKEVFIANYIMGLFPLLISARVSGKNLKFLKEKTYGSKIRIRHRRCCFRSR